jgi:hypothetical protein
MMLPYIPIVAAAALAVGFGAYFIWKAIPRTNLRFDAEEVTITLTPGRAAVAGRYTFVNAGAKDGDFKMMYPFPASKMAGAPENVAFTDGRGEPLPCEWKDGRAYFTISAPAGATVAVNVYFEQALRGDAYVYILKSTRTWKRPIKDATFVVDAPAEMGAVTSIYPLNEKAATEGRRQYELHRTDFYPSADLELTWKPPGRDEKVNHE